MITTEIAVVGMTCDHCVKRVSGELSALDGVQSVDVDLASGAVAIRSAEELSPADIREAVEEAGYELAGA